MQNLYIKNTLTFPLDANFFSVGPRHHKTNKRSLHNFVADRLAILTTFLNVVNYKTSAEVMDHIKDLIEHHRPPPIEGAAGVADEPPQTTQSLSSQMRTSLPSTAVGSDRDAPVEDIPVASDVAIGYGASSSAQVEIFHEEGEVQERPKKKKKKKRKGTEA